MIIYEVNIKINHNRLDSYLQWLVPHIRELLTCDGFIEASYSLEQRAADKEFAHVVVHYFLESLSDLDDYFELHAPRFRAEAQGKFGALVRYERRILEVQGSITRD